MRGSGAARSVESGPKGCVEGIGVVVGRLALDGLGWCSGRWMMFDGLGRSGRRVEAQQGCPERKRSLVEGVISVVQWYVVVYVSMIVEKMLH